MQEEGPFDRACRESALFTELQAIADDNAWERLDSDAKRQHFVPQMLLRGFAVQSGEKHRLFQLDVASGKPQRTDTEAAASRRYFYRPTDPDGKVTNRLEGLLSVVESHSTPALQALLGQAGEVSSGERATLAFFFAMQMQRTPVAVAQIMGVANATLQAVVGEQLTNREKFADDYRRLFGEASDENIETFRQSMIETVRGGRVEMVDPGGAAFAQGLSIAPFQAEIIFDSEWRLLRRSCAFVTSDRGFAIHDPAPPYPWSTQALLSSPESETTIPLTTDVCLLVRLGDPNINEQELDEADAMAINLRTYGWADDFIFGATQDLVTAVRRAAKARPPAVIRQKPMSHVVLLNPDPDDDSIARANRARGWPERLLHEGAYHDYIVVPHDRRAPKLYAEVDKIVEARMRRALGVGEEEPLPGGIRVETIDPNEVSR
jgi:hypothetical protein